jgi:mono/diheme cytochrome c family protein
MFAVAFGALAIASSAFAESRGELLYSTHCIACHTSQMHWRDKRAATDWVSLNTQVRRWKDAASLAWSEEEILEVADYLNDRIYRFERAPGAVSLLGQPQAPQLR